MACECRSAASARPFSDRLSAAKTRSNQFSMLRESELRDESEYREMVSRYGDCVLCRAWVVIANVCDNTLHADRECRVCWWLARPGLIRWLSGQRATRTYYTSVGGQCVQQVIECNTNTPPSLSITQLQRVITPQP